MRNNPISRALSNFATYQNCSGDTVRAAYEQLEKYQKTEEVLQRLADWFGLSYEEGDVYICPLCDEWSHDKRSLTHLAGCPFNEVKELLDGLLTLPD